MQAFWMIYVAVSKRPPFHSLSVISLAVSVFSVLFRKSVPAEGRDDPLQSSFLGTSLFFLSHLDPHLKNFVLHGVRSRSVLIFFHVISVWFCNIHRKNGSPFPYCSQYRLCCMSVPPCFQPADKGGDTMRSRRPERTSQGTRGLTAQEWCWEGTLCIYWAHTCSQQ